MTGVARIRCLVGALGVAFAFTYLTHSGIARAEQLAVVHYDGSYSELASEEEPRTKAFFTLIISFDFSEEGSFPIYDGAYAHDYQPAARSQSLTISNGDYQVVGFASPPEGCLLLASPTFNLGQNISIWQQTLLDGEQRLRAQAALPTHASAGGLFTVGRDCPTADPPTSMIEAQLIPYDQQVSEAQHDWGEVDPSINIAAKHLPPGGIVSKSVSFHFTDPNSLLNPSWQGKRDKITITGTFTASFPHRHRRAHH